MSVRVEFHAGPLPPSSPTGAAGAGAVVQFEGVIRPHEHDRPLRAMEYEAYRPMAELMLRELAEQVRSKHALQEVLVQHSVGVVPVGDRSFRLVIAARHRAPALEAMAEFINRMKQDVPIWKRPLFVESELCA